MTIRVAIVDDDALVRTGLRLILRAMPEITVVGEATDGREVIDLLERTSADVLLLDVRMQFTNGMTVIRSTRERFPDIRIVLMSTIIGPEFQAHASNVGADEFLPKTADATQIRQAITGRRSPVNPRAPKALTDQEAVVAARVAEGATNAEISVELSLSPNTVKTYVSRVLTKLGLDNRVQLAIYLREHDMLQREPEGG